MMKHYKKLLEGITVEQLHDHRGLKFPLKYMGFAMGPTAFRQPLRYVQIMILSPLVSLSLFLSNNMLPFLLNSCRTDDFD